MVRKQNGQGSTSMTKGNSYTKSFQNIETYPNKLAQNSSSGA